MPQPTRMCLDCQVMTQTPIMLWSIERPSGPPFSVYACTDCAPYRLTPEESMRLLAEHCETCPECTPAESCALGLALGRVAGRCLRR